jgi:serine/threonine-protein kinase
VQDVFGRLKDALADRYAIQEELGAGGMATVYLAEDLKHHRKVALKVLRPELAAILGGERFLKEIEVTANLQHPHILPLHDSGEADSFLYYVMPYVEGESLREKLNRDKQLGVDETVESAKGVAAALDYAHRQGVIHRDIKPENILIHDGQPVVADFGIALAVTTAGGTRLTETGLSLGTPQYMSPEQATGEREVTARSDVYSLGAVIYEMLVGDPPHTGNTVQAIVAKVVSAEPQPISDMRHTVPGNVQAAVQKALAKVPADRFGSAAKFAEALKNPAFTLPTTANLARTPTTRLGLAIEPRWLGWVIPLAFAALAGLAVAGWWKQEELHGNPTRFVVPVPTGYTDFFGNHTLALSSDGRMLVYGTEGRLYIKALDEFEGEPLIGTEGAMGPFFSPDGRWLGFTQRGTLRKLSIDGGASIEIARGVGANHSGSWDKNDAIVYAPMGGQGLMRVSADGGIPEQITTVDDDALENSHLWPQVLPGSDLVMYTVIGPSGGWSDAKIVVEDVKTGRRTTVRERATYGRYLPSGHLLYAQATGTLVAVPFDLGRLEVTGSPVPVQSDVRLAMWGGAASCAVSDNGTLAVVLGSIYTSMSLTWVDRNGRLLRQLADAVYGGSVDLSPDGRRLALDIRQPNNDDIVLIDAATGEQDRFTFDPPEDETPIWSPDGRRVAYASGGTGQDRRIYIKPVDAATEPTLLYTAKRHLHLSSWSPDGRWLVFSDLWDIWALNVDSAEYLIPIAASDADEIGAQFSPDGRWLAYTSNETGRNEVYVVSFPGTTAKQQVSTDGGASPVWAGSSKELFFMSGDTLMAVSVSTGSAFSRGGTPRPLFVAPGVAASNRSGYRNYDVTSDGTRFVLRVTKLDAVAKEVHVVLNFFEELKARVGN